MLLHCSTSYCQTDNSVPSFTGEEIRTVNVPMTYIRKVDSILIDYDYLKQIDAVKDSELKEYAVLVDELTNQLDKSKKDNSKLKKRHKALSWVTIGTALGLLLTIIFK